MLDQDGRKHSIPFEIDRFVQVVERLGTPVMSEIKISSWICSDCFHYTIKIHRNGVTKELVFEEPIFSGKESDDVRTVREFLGRSFVGAPPMGK